MSLTPFAPGSPFPQSWQVTVHLGLPLDQVSPHVSGSGLDVVPPNWHAWRLASEANSGARVWRVSLHSLLMGVSAFEELEVEPFKGM